MRASTPLRMRRDECIQVLPFAGPSGPIAITITTRYVDEGYSTLVPRGIEIECRGPAKSLDEAVRDFWEPARSCVGMISFCGNADVDDFGLWLAYDATRGKTERPFLQEARDPDVGVPREGRPLRAQPSLKFMGAVCSHAEADRLVPLCQRS